MAKAIKAPKMGNTVESIILGDIKVKVGDTIKAGDVLFEYETDKSTTEFKSEDSGEVLKIFYEAGDEVKVLEPVLIIGKKGDDISEWEKISKNEESAPIKEKEANVSEAKQEQQSSNDSSSSLIKEKVQESQSQNQKIFVSPRAKMIAKSLDVDLKNVDHVSGVNNRVMEKDIIQNYYQDIDKNNIAQEFLHTKFTPVRKAIAKSMEGSLQHGAQLTLMAPFDASNLLNVRSIIKGKVANKEAGVENSSINDLIVYVLARALVEFPHINSLIGPDYYDAYNVAHVAIAVDAPKGLFVPVVRNASEISLNELTRISKELIIKTKEGKLGPKDQTGGTFTISNLGLSGVTGFTPILNPPQAALLGVGSPIKRLKMVKNGIVEYSEIILSLTMDHRPFDGAKGAEFLQELKQRLENVSYDQFK